MANSKLKWTTTPDVQLDQIKTLLQNKIDFKPMTTIQSILFSKGCFVFIVITYIFLIGILVYLWRVWAWNKYLQNCIRGFNMPDNFTSYYAQKFSNVYSFKPGKLPSYAILKKYSWHSVPSDATINDRDSGFLITINDTSVNIGRIRWHWVRYYNNRRVDYYKWTTVIYGKTPNQRYKDVRIDMHSKSMLDWKHRELENREFNRKFSYRTNDPVALRMIFTPAAQEYLSNKPDIGQYEDFHLFNGQFMMTFSKHRKFSKINIPVTKDKEKFIHEIAIDLKQDILFIEKILIRLCIYRNILFSQEKFQSIPK